jgi:hypothetical protein
MCLIAKGSPHLRIVKMYFGFKVQKRTYCEQRTNGVHWLQSGSAGFGAVANPEPLSHMERDYEPACPASR